jgi:hypothetical protein
VEWQAGGGFTWNDWDALPGVHNYAWNFCHEGELPGPHVRTRLAPLPKSVVLVRDTRNVTDYGSAGAHVINRSLGIDRIRTAYGHEIQAYHVADAPKPPVKPGGRIQRDSYYAFRMPLAKAPEGRSPRVAEKPGQAPGPVTPLPGARTGPGGRGPSAADRESQDLAKRQAAARKRLQAEQQRELRQPPRGVDPNELRREHAEEQRALDEQAARERHIQEVRRQQEQQRERQRPSQEQRQQPKGKGERREPQQKHDAGKKGDSKQAEKQPDRQEPRQK